LAQLVPVRLHLGEQVPEALHLNVEGGQLDGELARSVLRAAGI
jgi:hypothetical protein